MKCPICGGKLKVQHTTTTPDYIIRYRKCARCGSTAKTIEENDPEPNRRNP